MLPSDPERCYKRALEIMDELEAEAKDQLGGRLFVRDTAWRNPRKVIEAFMYLQLYDSALRGSDLEDAIYGLLDPVCNIRATAPRDLPIFRPSAFNRSHRGEFNRNEVYTADGPLPIRAAAVDHESNDTDFPFVL